MAVLEGTSELFSGSADAISLIGRENTGNFFDSGRFEALENGETNANSTT